MLILLFSKTYYPGETGLLFDGDGSVRSHAALNLFVILLDGVVNLLDSEL